MNRDITIDELNTYLYCGEYYKQYQKGNLFLYDERSTIDIYISVLLKWIICYKAQHGIVPSEEELLLQVAKVRKTLSDMNISLFSNYINNIYLCANSFRETCKSLDFEFILKPQRYYDSGVSLSFHYWLAADKTIYLPSTLTNKNLLNSPLLHFHILTIPEGYKLNVINIKNFTISIRPYDILDRHKQTLTTFYEKIFKSIADENMVPKYQCNLTSCPHYNNCRVISYD